MQRIRHFFIDESGNTGDATGTGTAFDFDQQPIFVLACLGVHDEAEFAANFAELKARHRLRGPEVKSSAAWTKPDFYMDLLLYIDRLDLPVLLEVVDKRFFIAAQLVNTLILPPAGGSIDHSPEVAFMRNTIAEFVAGVLPSSCLSAFVEACTLASREGILRAYDVLLEALGTERKEDLASFVRMAANHARNEFLEEGEIDPEVIRHRLPPPDATPRGKPVWMLPHLSSLTNLYARLNTYTGGNLKGVTLAHDQQLQFGEILRAGKAAAEELSSNGIKVRYGPADYVFREQADLLFMESGRSAGIQAADVLAGYAMRLLLSWVVPGAEPRHDGDWQMRRLLAHDDAERGLGINFVMTTALRRELGLTSAPDPFRLPW